MMKTTKMTRIEKSCQNRAYAPAVPTGCEASFGRGWEGTREQRGNNWGNRFDSVFYDVFFYLLVFVPLFSLSNSPLGLNAVFLKPTNKNSSPLPICLPRRREQGTREQSAFDPGIYGVFVFPPPREQPLPCSLPSPERRSPCLVR